MFCLGVPPRGGPQKLPTARNAPAFVHLTGVTLQLSSCEAGFLSKFKAIRPTVLAILMAVGAVVAPLQTVVHP